MPEYITAWNSSLREPYFAAPLWIINRLLRQVYFLLFLCFSGLLPLQWSDTVCTGLGNREVAHFVNQVERDSGNQMMLTVNSPDDAQCFCWVYSLMGVYGKMAVSIFMSYQPSKMSVKNNKTNTYSKHFGHTNSFNNIYEVGTIVICIL